VSVITAPKGSDLQELNEIRTPHTEAEGSVTLTLTILEVHFSPNHQKRIV